jgi:DNA-binding response OmpR family regulator
MTDETGITEDAGLLSPSSRILVVDDDPGLLVLMAKMLERIGPKPLTAETGTGALAILEREPIDLLILDLMLPDINGLQVLKQIREDFRFDSMPVLILSAKADPDTISEGFELGADAYLTKPYLPNTLVSRVRTLMAQGRRTPDESTQD